MEERAAGEVEGLAEVGRTAGSPGLGRGDSSRARGTGEPPGPAPQRCRGAQRPRSERGPQHPWVGLSPQMVLASSELPAALCVGTGNHHMSETARVWGDEASSGHGGLTETLGVLQTSYKPVSTPGAGSVPRERRNSSDREGMCPQLSRKWALGVKSTWPSKKWYFSSQESTGMGFTRGFRPPSWLFNVLFPRLSPVNLLGRRSVPGKP